MDMETTIQHVNVKVPTKEFEESALFNAEIVLKALGIDGAATVPCNCGTGCGKTASRLALFSRTIAAAFMAGFERGAAALLLEITKSFPQPLGLPEKEVVEAALEKRAHIECGGKVQ